MHGRPLPRWFCPLCGRTYAGGVEHCPHDQTPLQPVPDEPTVRAVVDEPTVRRPSPAAFLDVKTVPEAELAQPRLPVTLVEPEEVTGQGAFQPEALVGQTLGIYRLRQVLRTGRTGVILQAEQDGVREPVAIKVIRPELAELREGLLPYFNDLGTASRLGHRHIVEVLDRFPNQPQRCFVVMELLVGENLRELLARMRRLTSRRTIAMALQICSALRAAHAARLVHRDLRPEHIMLARRESRDDQVKILDFGVARLQQAARARGLVQLLPPSVYRAPELVRDGTLEDPRSDIFSLGVILYQALTGKLPFADQVPSRGRPAPLTQLSRNIEPALDELVMSCLRQEPERRIPSVEELERGLKRVLRQDGSPRAGQGSAEDKTPVPEPEPPGLVEPRMRRSGRWLTILLAAVLTVALAVVGVLVLDRFFGRTAGVKPGAAPAGAPSAPPADRASALTADLGSGAHPPDPDQRLSAPDQGGSAPATEPVQIDAAPMVVPAPASPAPEAVPPRVRRPRRAPPARAPVKTPEPRPADRDEGTAVPPKKKITKDQVKDPFGD